ncbi:ABC transporter ATP-binding protein/permease [Couchioplanes caeruleus]|uniref:ATP-binding cassette domain-containing protein n=1 Tax=Couchioplanes caeruleus TaxID=56438 RepID=UPI0020BE5160|nr:ABC transporter ATP-binding protein [Couchioplanes caeruleus]UQU66525.1 ABC transporter ATP-binding protein/permease [Couchioplanes caeruleus]
MSPDSGSTARVAGREAVTVLRRHRRAVGSLLAWSVPEAAPAMLTGFVVARAVDQGFLAGRPWTGTAWLALLVAAAVLGAWGARNTHRAVAGVVEPFRDDLTRRVVTAGVTTAARHAGTPATDGAVARLTNQVEGVRDSFAGLILVSRGFVVTVLAALLGTASLAPSLLLLVAPPLLGSMALFAVALRRGVRWQRDFLYAGEQLADRTAAVTAAARDVAACRAADRAARYADEAIAAQARAERALARLAAVRSLTVAVGGWLPLLAVLAGATRVTGHGLSTGALIGVLTYLAQVVVPTLDMFVQTVGSAGLRFVITLDRLVRRIGPGDAVPADPRPSLRRPAGSRLELRGVTFRYGAAARPVLHDFGLTVHEADHLAVVGPSGVGKSTLAGLLCGTISPDDGAVLLGGVPIEQLDPAARARHRVLIPQEAYVFPGSVADNLRYLNPEAGERELLAAVDVLGAGALLERLGGLAGEVRPRELSAGERQLLTLVRAYVAPAPVAVLDEATCHLDPAAEERVERAFATRGALVVIAHRISSAMRSRRVLLLDGDRAVLGDHRSLQAVSARYREMTGYWTATSEPAGAPGPVDGVDPAVRADLRRDAGQPVAHRTG